MLNIFMLTIFSENQYFLRKLQKNCSGGVHLWEFKCTHFWLTLYIRFTLNGKFLTFLEFFLISPQFELAFSVNARPPPSEFQYVSALRMAPKTGASSEKINFFFTFLET